MRDLRVFDLKARAAVYAAKVLLASHNLLQAEDGKLNMRANKDGTFTLEWKCKFELEDGYEEEKEDRKPTKKRKSQKTRVAKGSSTKAAV